MLGNSLCILEKNSKTIHGGSNMEITLNGKNFEEEVLKSDKPVIVDFWASWCGPCQMLGPVIAQIAEEHPEVKVGKVNVDDEEGLSIQYDILSIPTIMLFKNGKLERRLVGFYTKEQIETQFELKK